MPKITLSFHEQEFILNDMIESLYSDSQATEQFEKIGDILTILQSEEATIERKIQASHRIQNIFSAIKAELQKQQSTGQLLNSDVVLQSSYLNNRWITKSNELFQLFFDVLEEQTQFYLSETKKYENQRFLALLHKASAEKQARFNEVCLNITSILNKPSFARPDIPHVEKLLREAINLEPNHGRVKYFQWRLAKDKAIIQKDPAPSVPNLECLELAVYAPEDFPEKNNACIHLLSLKKQLEGTEQAESIYQKLLSLNLLRNLTEEAKEQLDIIFPPALVESASQKKSSNHQANTQKLSSKKTKVSQKKSPMPEENTEQIDEKPLTEEEKQQAALREELNQIRHQLNDRDAIKACLALLIGRRSELETHHCLHEVHIILAERCGVINPQMAITNLKKAAEQILTPGHKDKDSLLKIIMMLQNCFPYTAEKKAYIVDLCKQTIGQIQLFESNQTIPHLSELSTLYKICQNNEQSNEDIRLLLQKILQHPEFAVYYESERQIHLHWNYAVCCAQLGKTDEANEHYQIIADSSIITAHKIFARMALGLLPSEQPVFSDLASSSIFELPVSPLLETRSSTSKESATIMPAPPSPIETQLAPPHNQNKNEVSIENQIRELTDRINRLSETTNPSYTDLLLERNTLSLQLIKLNTKNKSYYQDCYTDLIHTSINWILDPKNNCSPSERSEAYFHQGALCSSLGQMSQACQSYYSGIPISPNKQKIKEIKQEIDRLNSKLADLRKDRAALINKMKEKIIARKTITDLDINLSPDNQIQFEYAQQLRFLVDFSFTQEPLEELYPTVELISLAAINILNAIKPTSPEERYDLHYEIAHCYYGASLGTPNDSEDWHYRQAAIYYLNKSLEVFDTLSSHKKEEITSCEQIARIHLLLGQLYYNDKKYSLALKHYTKSFQSQEFLPGGKAEPSKVNIYYQCMMIAESLKQPAERFFELTKACNPDAIRLLIFTFSDEAHKKVKEGASNQDIIDIYHKVLNILYDNDNFITHHTHLSTFERIIYLSMIKGDYDFAMELAQLSVDLVSQRLDEAEQHAPILCQYVRILLRDITICSDAQRVEKLQHAETILLRAISIAPESAEAHYELAWLYQISGRKDEALKFYKKVSEFDKNGKYIVLAKGNEFLLKKNYYFACLLYKQYTSTLNRQGLDFDPLFQANYRACIEFAINLNRASRNAQEKDQARGLDSSYKQIEEVSSSTTSLGNFYSSFHAENRPTTPRKDEPSEPYISKLSPSGDK